MWSASTCGCADFASAASDVSAVRIAGVSGSFASAADGQYSGGLSAVGGSAVLRVVGTRPLILGTHGVIRLLGRVEAGSRTHAEAGIDGPGPGATFASPHCETGQGEPGVADFGSAGGGGGGGYGSNGGKGGKTSGGFAGSASPVAPFVVGGCRGGKGGNAAGMLAGAGGAAGLGGGAVHFASMVEIGSEPILSTISTIQQLPGVISAALVYQCADSAESMNEEVSDADRPQGFH